MGHSLEPIGQTHSNPEPIGLTGALVHGSGILNPLGLPHPLGSDAEVLGRLEPKLIGAGGGGGGGPKGPTPGYVGITNPL